MDFELKIHKKQRTMYIPKTLHNILGLEVTAIPNMNSVYIFPKTLNKKDAVRSLIVIKKELEYQVELQGRNKKT